MNSTSTVVNALWFGRLPYLHGLKIQDFLFEKVAKARLFKEFTDPRQCCHYLCLLEHHPVYTVGLRDYIYTAEEEKRLKSLGAEFHRIKRGGQITFHGPGQLVAYPIFDLKKLHVRRPDMEITSVGARRFVHLVEEALIQLCKEDYSITNVDRTDNPGVWVEGTRKIAAIGVQIRHDITSHGFALNCNTDLKWFDHIVPCGLEGKTVTSLTKELKNEIRVKDLLVPVCQKFEKIFQCPVELQDTQTSDMIYQEVTHSKEQEQQADDKK
uniref:Octanoyl-[acyl-carrier-protein]:protein N-octanoyltransferase LIPT2, mitochondrial n=1 Tax=Acrobeloides nanus TaxID=290746 RepID=A0A914DED1_9BILA